MSFAVALFACLFAFAPFLRHIRESEETLAAQEIDALASEFGYPLKDTAWRAPALVPDMQQQNIDAPVPMSLQSSPPVNEQGVRVPGKKFGYRLVIPKIGVDMPIVEGQDGQQALRLGAWHIPGTGDAVRGGNLVVAGHRYLRTRGQETLFRLDEVVVGDLIQVVWEGAEYTYRVERTEVVTPDRVDVLDQTKDHQLTIITCHPNYSTAQRLIVNAKPVL